MRNPKKDHELPPANLDPDGYREALENQTLTEFLAQRRSTKTRRVGDQAGATTRGAGSAAAGTTTPRSQRVSKRAASERSELAAIEAHFHAVMRGRAASLIDEHHLTLPHLEMSILGEANAAWFPISGMYGGFKYWFERRGTALVLITDSWCRVVDGSEQRHEVTARGATLIEEDEGGLVITDS